ncbi:hypothetical protein GGQ00_003109 [Salinibacter ruber]|jgi:hypothetical protein|nr:hypothetical protein [Salinibacter ruber]MCS4044649.1 hypothetical protein [Salinibacter ruber]MCS4223740.1 hypothetical protein [Salinibacter ruber]
MAHTPPFSRKDTDAYFDLDRAELDTSYFFLDGKPYLPMSFFKILGEALAAASENLDEHESNVAGFVLCAAGTIFFGFQAWA